MKKLMTLTITLVIFTLMTAFSHATPIYIGVKIGIFAKWQIKLDDCDDGKGLCLTFKGDNPVNFCGYDNADNKIYIKIDKKSPEAKYFTGKAYIVEEDSPVSPALVQKFTNMPKPPTQYVVIKAGTYLITNTPEHYIIGLNYYFQK